MIQDIQKRNEAAQPMDKVLEVLHRDFPQCFNAEGKFDAAAFNELLNDKVDLVKEGNGFNFLGKNYASLLAAMDTTTVLVPDLEHNGKRENANSQNVYISGDNLDALKHLVKSYAGKDQVVVYGKIPQKSVCIPNITNDLYSPDFMYVVQRINGKKELNIVIETKDVPNDEAKRTVEDAKIRNAEKFFQQLKLDGYDVKFCRQLQNKGMANIISELLEDASECHE